MFGRVGLEPFVEANLVGGLYLQTPVNGKVGAAVNGGPIIGAPINGRK